MTEVVHFFTDAGALCRVSSATRLTVVPQSLTCPACAAVLAVRELEAEKRPVPAPKVVVRLPRAS